ncbi:MAG: monomethylamine:corrinoid methyltransferase, partial [Candidatus Hodarchaeota archaeon]
MVTPPWRINEVLNKSQNGPVCLEKDFDLKLLVPELRRVIKEYDVQFDPKIPVPSDNTLADSLWNAAMDLYLEVGTLCTDTHRRIIFEENEIKEALSNFPGKFTMGYGRDSKEITHRKIKDSRKPY